MPQALLSKVFGTILSEHRQGQGLTQEALAERAGIHPTHVSRLETGARVPSLAVVWRLSQALDVTIVELITEFDRAYRRAKR